MPRKPNTRTQRTLSDADITALIQAARQEGRQEAMRTIGRQPEAEGEPSPPQTAAPPLAPTPSAEAQEAHVLWPACMQLPRHLKPLPLKEVRPRIKSSELGALSPKQKRARLLQRLTEIVKVKDVPVDVHLKDELGEVDYSLLRNHLIGLEMDGLVFRQTLSVRGWSSIIVWGKRQPRRSKEECLGVSKTELARTTVMTRLNRSTPVHLAPEQLAKEEPLVSASSFKHMLVALVKEGVIRRFLDSRTYLPVYLLA